MADRIVQFEGKAHHFPGDASDDEILQALKALHAPVSHLTDEQIQANVHQPSGTLENALGNALTMGVGNLFGANADIGRGAMDASARMVNNAGKLTGAQSPQDAAQINAQLNPQNTAETIGQVIPSAALAAAVPGSTGLAGAGLDALASGGITALDTGDPTKALEAGAGGAVLGSAGRALGKLTPSIKWGLVNSALKAMKMGGLGAIAGAYAGHGGGIGESLKDAALGALIQKSLGGASPTAQAKLAQAVNSGSTSTAAKMLWRLLPPAVAHTGAEQSYEDARNSMAPTDTASLAALAKRRLEAQSVIAR